MPTFKQLRKQKIKEQLKEQKVNKMSKTLADQYMNMTDEDWQEFAKALHEEMEQAKETKEEGEVK